MSHTTQSLQGRLGAITRWDPENIAERDRLLREIRELQATDYIQNLVATAPPLSQEQRDRLALLLRDPAPSSVREVAQP